MDQEIETQRSCYSPKGTQLESSLSWDLNPGTQTTEPAFLRIPVSLWARLGIHRTTHKLVFIVGVLQEEGMNIRFLVCTGGRSHCCLKWVWAVEGKRSWVLR